MPRPVRPPPPTNGWRRRRRGWVRTTAGDAAKRRRNSAGSRTGSIDGVGHRQLLGADRVERLERRLARKGEPLEDERVETRRQRRPRADRRAGCMGAIIHARVLCRCWAGAQACMVLGCSMRSTWPRMRGGWSGAAGGFTWPRAQPSQQPDRFQRGDRFLSIAAVNATGSPLGRSPRRPDAVSARRPVRARRTARIPDAATFDALVAHATLPMVVDFWAPWCGPCHMVAPEIARVPPPTMPALPCREGQYRRGRGARWTSRHSLDPDMAVFDARPGGCAHSWCPAGCRHRGIRHRGVERQWRTRPDPAP